jgi:hypothetical protein
MTDKPDGSLPERLTAAYVRGMNETAEIASDQLMRHTTERDTAIAERDACRAEVERLQAAEAECRNSRGFVAAENERLRASLSEMLESFTEPEDDNDILRRARAALAPTKAS